MPILHQHRLNCRYSIVLSFFFLLAPLVFNVDSSQLEDDAVSELLGLSLEQLMELEVTLVSKKEEKLFNAPAAVYVLTQEDIRRSGAVSLPEALRMVPGLNIGRII